MNPINYATGLVAELDFAQRDGDKDREATVREQLTWAAGELEKVNPEPLSEPVRTLLTEAKSAATEALASKPKRATAKSA